MDLLFLVILVIIVAIVFQDTKRLVYLMGILEVFFRLIHGIGDRLGITELNSFINQYIPSSIFSILSSHTDGILYTVLCWVIIGILAMFLFYLVKYFFSGKKL